MDIFIQRCLRGVCWLLMLYIFIQRCLVRMILFLVLFKFILVRIMSITRTIFFLIILLRSYSLGSCDKKHYTSSIVPFQDLLIDKANAQFILINYHICSIILNLLNHIIDLLDHIRVIPLGHEFTYDSVRYNYVFLLLRRAHQSERSGDVLSCWRTSTFKII